METNANGVKQEGVGRLLRGQHGMGPGRSWQPMFASVLALRNLITLRSDHNF